VSNPIIDHSALQGVELRLRGKNAAIDPKPTPGSSADDAASVTMAVIAAFSAIPSDVQDSIKAVIRREVRRCGPPVILGSRPADCYDRAWNELLRQLLHALAKVPVASASRDQLTYSLASGTMRWMRVSQMRGSTPRGSQQDPNFDSVRAPAGHPVERVQALAAEIYRSQEPERRALLHLLHQIPAIADGEPEEAQRAVSRHLNRLLQALNVHIACQTCGEPSITLYKSYGKREILGSITLQHASTSAKKSVHKPDWKAPLTLIPRNTWLGDQSKG
jgi:hypothetical protein